MSTSAYRISIHDLARRPGVGKDIVMDLPAPDDLGTVVIAVPKGEPVHLDLRAEAASDGVYVSGTLTTRAVGECVRCLDPIERSLEIEVAELYLFPESVARAHEEGDEEAAEMLQTDGETLDLEPILRDDIVTELPFQPLCRPDCPGLCPECGIRMADAEPGHEHRVIDPRFSALEGLLGATTDDGDPAVP